MTQIKHPTHHTNHLDQTILQSMINMLTKKIQHIIITKIKAHTNIVGNVFADCLAKLGDKLPHKSPLYLYKKAHSTPYCFHKDE